MIEWSANEFSRKYDGVKVRDGEHLAEMLRAIGHSVVKTTETGATIKALVGGLEMLIIISVPAKTSSDGTIHAKPLYDTGIKVEEKNDFYANCPALKASKEERKQGTKVVVNVPEQVETPETKAATFTVTVAIEGDGE